MISLCSPGLISLCFLPLISNLQPGNYSLLLSGPPCLGSPLLLSWLAGALTTVTLSSPWEHPDVFHSLPCHSPRDLGWVWCHPSECKARGWREGAVEAAGSCPGHTEQATGARRCHSLHSTGVWDLGLEGLGTGGVQDGNTAKASR